MAIRRSTRTRKTIIIQVTTPNTSGRGICDPRDRIWGRVGAPRRYGAGWSGVLWTNGDHLRLSRRPGQLATGEPQITPFGGALTDRARPLPQIRKSSPGGNRDLDWREEMAANSRLRPEARRGQRREWRQCRFAGETRRGGGQRSGRSVTARSRRRRAGFATASSASRCSVRSSSRCCSAFPVCALPARASPTRASAGSPRESASSCCRASAM